MKRTTVILILFLSSSGLFSQNYLDSICWVKIINPVLNSVEGNNYSGDEQLNNLLASYNATSFEKALPFANNPELLKLHEIQCNCDIDNLITDLSVQFNGDVTDFSKHEVPDTVTVYDPVDDMWALTSLNSYLWHLKRTQTDLAWDITRGSPGIKIAIIDYDVDIAHPDLVGKIVPPSAPYNLTPYDCNTSHTHGTLVAGHAGAETTEQGNTANGQAASAGFKNKVIFYNSYGTRQDFLQKAMHASFVMGAKIITSCAGAGLGCQPQPSTGEELIVKDILDNGTAIIMPAGNGWGGYHCAYNNVKPNWHAFYPFNPIYDDRIIIVSSTGSNDKHRFYGASGTGPNGEETHSHFEAVDFCTPGIALTGIKPSNCGTPLYGHLQTGTSFSAPVTSSIASLLLTVNPCLQPGGLKDILKNTTDPIVDAAEFPGTVGTGRVNAFEAVKAAQQSVSTSLDLYIKDRPEDFGIYAGYNYNTIKDKSPDIWVRNQADGFTNQTSQNPKYIAGQPVYVYVRVRNKSCVDAYGNEQLSLYWSKASSWSSWPDNWNGSDPLTGNQIGTINLGNLPAGRDTILEFTWNILNPYILHNWTPCLLARIEMPYNDPITVYPNRLDEDVYFNNNIAMRNVVIINYIHPHTTSHPNGTYILIGNPTVVEDQTYNIKFAVPETVYGQSLNEVAEIKIIFDDQGWGLIADYITPNELSEIDAANKTIISRSKSFQLTNVPFPSNTRVPIYVGFSFLADEMGVKKQFKYDVNQYLAEDNSLLGGEHFIVRTHDRTDFNADAGGDKDIKLNESVTVSASDINEVATYNWYDMDGSLIFTGKDLVVSPQITETYKLEVIANADGVKDYDEVIVAVKDCYIETISPNPASNDVVVAYKTENTTSGYIMVLNATATTNYNYIIDVNQLQTTFNVANFQTGAYSVILVCDGVAVDMKTLIVQ